MRNFWKLLGLLLVAVSMLSGESAEIRLPVKPAQPAMNVAEDNAPFQAADAHVLVCRAFC